MFSFSSANGNVIQGNFIGTDAGGTYAVSNKGNGIVVSQGVTNCLIGGTNAGAGNVISGNANNGIFIGPFQTSPLVSGVQVYGNRIGFAADPRPPAPTGSRSNTSSRRCC